MKRLVLVLIVCIFSASCSGGGYSGTPTPLLPMNPLWEQVLQSTDPWVFDVTAYGALGDGVTDDTAAFLSAYTAALSVGGGTVYVPASTTTYRVQLSVSDAGARVSWRGAGTAASRLQAVDVNMPAITLSGVGDWAYPFAIRDLGFFGNLRTHDGFKFDNVSGVNGIYAENVSFDECRYGYYSNAPIWQTFNHCTWERCSYAIYIKLLSTMHGGNALFTGCNVNLSEESAFTLIGRAVGAGGVINFEQIHWVSGIIEGSKGFSVFLKDATSGTWPILFDNVHMEQNTPTASTVTIEGVDYTPPYVWYLENTTIVELHDMPLRAGASKLINSHLITHRAQHRGGATSATFIIDSTSTVEHHDPTMFGYDANYPSDELIIGTIKNRHTDDGLSVTFRKPLGNVFSPVHENMWDGGFNKTFTATSDPNGLTYLIRTIPMPPHLRVTLPAGTDYDDGLGLFPAVELTDNYWYVWSFTAQTTSITLDLVLQGNGGTSDLFGGCSVDVLGGVWRQYWGLSKSQATESGDALWIYSTDGGTFQIADMQLVEFVAEQDAQQYINLQLTTVDHSTYLSDSNDAPGYVDLFEDGDDGDDSVRFSGQKLAADATMYPVYTAMVDINNAEIKALTTPVELVAAPGAGILIEVVSATLILDYGSNVLSEPSAPDDLALEYDDGSGQQIATWDTTGFITSSADAIEIALGGSVGGGAAAVTAAANVNKNVVLINTGGNYGGNAGNDTVMQVNIVYRIHESLGL